MHISSQVDVIKKLIEKIKLKENLYKIKNLFECYNENILYVTKIFINGEWIGITEKPLLLTEYLKNNRSIGAIDKTVSIIFDIFSRSIKINCDGGRMYRPLLKVIDNTI